MNFLYLVYASLLHLYPRAFREEFGDEMRADLADALADAATRGMLAIGLAFWREVRDLPMAVLREYWRERSRPKMEMDTHSQQPSRFKPISGLGILAVATPFFCAAVLDMGAFLGATTGYVSFAAFGGLIVLLLLGLIRGVPGWCLPTLGLFATILALPSLMVWAPLFFLLPSAVEWMRLVIGSGFPWFSLCLVTLITLGVINRIPGGVLYERVRRDWIWLAFALYGSAAMWLLLAFDDYVGEEPYVVVASGTLIVGACIYLRANRARHRFAALCGGLVVTVLIVAVGKWNLVPIQTWPLVIDEGLRWGEILGAIQSGAYLLVAVLVPPALVRLISRQQSQPPGPLPSSGEQGKRDQAAQAETPSSPLTS